MTAYSSRIEKLQVYPDHTRFDLDGNSVLLTEENAAPAVRAFQDFYAAAWEAYRARPAPTQPPAQRGFWKTAIQALNPSRLWKGLQSAVSRWLQPSAPRNPAILAPLPPPILPHAAPSREAAESPRPAQRPVAPASVVKPTGQPGGSTGGPLLLRSAYADQAGVHLLWLAGEAGKEKQTELLCSFESPVADRLQHCYSKLSEMGHPVVDLRVWRPQPDAAKPLIAATIAAKKPETGVIMKLQPGVSDTPGRAVVAPVNDAKALQVLTAPERLIDALHFAADSARPDAERLTYLRCATGRSGLKVIAVGTGENPEDPGTPAKWENIATWWEAHKKPAPAPTPAAPSKAPATEPAAELF